MRRSKAHQARPSGEAAPRWSNRRYGKDAKMRARAVVGRLATMPRRARCPCPINPLPRSFITSCADFRLASRRTGPIRCRGQWQRDAERSGSCWRPDLGLDLRVASGRALTYRVRTRSPPPVLQPLAMWGRGPVEAVSTKDQSARPGCGLPTAR
jgi:hypothetical protein